MTGSIFNILGTVLVLGYLIYIGFIRESGEYTKLSEELQGKDD